MFAVSGRLSQGEQKAASSLTLTGGNTVMPFGLQNSPRDQAEAGIEPNLYLGQTSSLPFSAPSFSKEVL